MIQKIKFDQKNQIWSKKIKFDPKIWSWSDPVDQIKFDPKKSDLILESKFDQKDQIWSDPDLIWSWIIEPGLKLCLTLSGVQTL